MKITAEVSLYPLKTGSLSKPIEDFCEVLRERGLEVATGPMSTLVSGEAERVFDGLKEAFVQSAQKGRAVMALKVSNACPEGSEG